MVFQTNQKVFKRTAILVCTIFLWETFFPVAAWALSGGPSQPEVQSFEPVGTSDMVDPFTGDFNYNIPLLDVEGYPINIAYHSGITADQEASWVGLGWNINPGAITRNMRGLPDDFDGDVIKKNFYIKPDRTLGGVLGGKIEAIGKDEILVGKMALNFGVFHNTYRGLGFEFGVAPSLSIGDKAKGSLNANIGYNSQSGYNVHTTLGARVSNELSKDKSELSTGASVSAGYNSRGGLKSLSFGINTAVQQTTTIIPKKKYWSTTTFSDDRSVSLSFGSPTYTPTITMPMKNSGLLFSGSVGTEAWTLHPGGSLTGYFSKNELADTSIERNAYGYLNLHNAQTDTSITDFNREKDGGFTREMAYLPVPQLTYDIFNVSGHGVGGVFRAYRNDIGVIGDDRMTNLNSNFDLSVEVGLGNIVHGGADIRNSRINTTGGKWDILSSVDFVEPTDDKTNAGYEASYFKNSGEMVKADAKYERYGKSTPYRVDITGSGEIAASNTMMNARGEKVYLPNNNSNSNARLPRNSAMSYITAAEGYAALDKKIRSFGINQLPDNGILSPSSLLDRQDPTRKGHHISEVTVNNPDGTRYVYGIPAYNNIQNEITFALSDGASKDCATGQVSYTKSANNKPVATGASELYSETSTPGYAHSYLLSGVLSDDYVDLTNNGITDDDLGTGVKFNYTRTQSDYKWRVPIDEKEASYNAGNRSDPYDDKASIVYGEKENWYLHSIETKNYAALFYISQREDGLGVVDLNGGKSAASRLYKLDSIILYAKYNGMINTTPIKKVRLNYDYSLCPGIDNANGTNGKLTLKEIIFVNGTSKKGYRNRYQFTYQNNLPYNLKSYDRWGNYLTYGGGSGCSQNDLYPSEAPYTPQDRDLADSFSSAWTLSQIGLPSGGTIKVHYEADDYAYVQDKRAMRMFEIAGFGLTPAYTSSNDMYEAGGLFTKQYVFFKLEDPSTDIKPSMQNLRHYFRDVDWVYFNAFVKLMNGKYDYVRGYLKPTGEYGIASGNSDYGYFKVKLVPIGDKEGSGREIHPISKAALQFMRTQVPHLVFPSSAPDEGSESKIKGSVGAIEEAKIMLTGYNTYCLDKGAATNVNLNKSFIRLNTPYGKKLGGGSRVKKIEFFDDWEGMSGRSGTSQITQGLQYDYSLPLAVEKNADGSKRSSGVACWEPEIGGDENPFKTLVHYTVNNKLALDNVFYQEGPFGESLMPAPVVGYRFVTVSQISPPGVGVRGTGYTVHEFYTAKDFPVKIQATPMEKLDNLNSPGNVIKEFLKLSIDEYVGASQGYSVELNDMHGKPKSKITYRILTDHKSQIVTGTKYRYVTEANKPSQLANTIEAITPHGIKISQSVGIETDMVFDTRQQTTENNSFTLGAGVDAGLITPVPPLPYVVPHGWPMPVNETTTFKSVVVSKVIRKSGILKSVEAIKEGSHIITENIAWDSETGEVLLTSTTNEFADTLYSLTYPAHWFEGESGLMDGNERMRRAYKNIGFRCEGCSNLCIPGDEIWLTGGSSPKRVWVDESSAIVDDNNVPQSIGGKKLLIYRSGYRNKASVPLFQLTTKADPLKQIGGVTYVSPRDSGVIDASGILYDDRWLGLSKIDSTSPCGGANDSALQIKDLFAWLNSNSRFCDSGIIQIYDNANPSIGPSWYGPGIDLFNMIDAGANAQQHWVKTHYTDPQEPSMAFYRGHPYTSTSIFNLDIYLGTISCATIDTITGIRPLQGSDVLLNVSDDEGNFYCIEATIDGNYCREVDRFKLTMTGVNGFRSGRDGNFRKKKEYYYLDQRKYVETPRVQTDGTWASFSPLYTFFNGSGYQGHLSLNDSDWNTKVEVSHYARNGQELENKDVIGNHSAARFAFNKTLPVAVAQNSYYLQIGNYSCDNAEELEMPVGPKSYWKFLTGSGTLPTFNGTISHTGLKSIELTAGDSLQAYIEVADGTDNYSLSTHPDRYINEEFYPLDGDYIISAWVKVDTSANAHSYERPHIKLSTNDPLQDQVLYPSGPIVDGWQRINEKIHFSTCASPYYVRLMSDSFFTTYFDDIRIHPNKSLMKSFVYDPITLRLMATLDENNYATYYEYDEEGNLIRTKQETERGVMTVRESRQSIKKLGN